MSDRIAVMSEGQVQQVGTPSEIYEHPANRFVAGFVGDANFIGGRITGRAGNEVDCRTDGGLALRADGTRAPQAEGATTLFLRPEKIRLVPPGTGTVDGRIETIQYLGDACLMDINIGETSPLLVSERMADIDQPRRAAGDVTGVVLDARSVQVLEG
jgi:spermidine/putrescine transport system ATP-binding protein